MPSLLALDSSTRCGWSFWPSAKGPTLFGTWRAPKAQEYGPRFRAFHDWLCDQVTDLEPDILAFESPLSGGALQTSEDVVRLLMGLASIAELVAELRGLRCFEVHNSTVKLRLAGTGRIPSKDKPRIMMAAAHAQGMMVDDDHQADSCGVALEVYATLGIGDAKPLGHLL